jgi:uncharacterized protein (UPF0276 family)
MDSDRKLRIGVRANLASTSIDKLTGDVDYILVTFRAREPWSDERRTRVAQLRRLVDFSLHGLDSFSSEHEFDGEALAQIQQMVEGSGAGWLSEHICFATPYQDYTLTFAATLTPESIDTVIANAVRLRNHLNIPLLLENLGRPVIWPWDTIDEIEAIQHITRASGCFLLLDLEQAVGGAETRGVPVREYVAQLPLDSVYEVHIGMDEESLSLLQEVLALAPVRAITLEGIADDVDDTRRALEHLRELVAQQVA